ncbi:hypothetical protein BD408DRAFT_420622 [Parasitella parasitica]|nr:hypothetical protein BD408DRAFT_420622 [Parasitella parasitica]
MASSTQKHKAGDQYQFESQSWEHKASQQERSSFFIARNFNKGLDEQNIQSCISQTTTFLRPTEPYSIVMDCAQFEGMTFDDNKELNEILRKQFPDGLILTMRAVGRVRKFFEISFLNEEGRVAALNRSFIIHGKTIVVNPTLAFGASVLQIRITDIPGLDSVSICNRLIEILNPCGDILELGLHYIPSGRWFNGRGFATISCVGGERCKGNLRPRMLFNEHREIKLDIKYL